MLVWNAMASMTPMMSPILRAAAEMPPIVAATLVIAWPPLAATSDAPSTSSFACRAFSAFCRTVAVSSSMDEAVSSRLDACSSVRLESSALPAAICREAVPTLSADSRIVPTAPASEPRIASRA